MIVSSSRSTSRLNVLNVFRYCHRQYRSKSDYVIVGAGSAGCVLANRLTEDPSVSVTLIEAGRSDRVTPSDLLLHMPTALALPMGFKRYNWGFVSEKEPALGGRQVPCHRGRGLGGSSSINGMVFVRGHPLDFAAWESLGAHGWNYNSVLPYYRKAENWFERPVDNQYRNDEGPLHVKNGCNANNTPLYQAFMEAGRQAGYGNTTDYNAYRQEGFSPMPMTVFHSGPLRGQRCSTASCYLRPVLSRPNLKVITGVMASRIKFSFDDANSLPRATAIEYCKIAASSSKCVSNDVQTLPIGKELLLCAGAIQSPQLLQVSGVGSRAHIDSLGVPLVADNSDVGNNLQDHLECFFQQEATSDSRSLAPLVSSPFRKLVVGLQWLVKRDGLAATNHFEAAAFVRSSAGVAYPDVQFHFLPVAISYDGSSVAESSTGHSFQIHVGTCRSKSRGHVRAKTSSMSDAPEIVFNYMSHEQDWIDMRNAVRIARQVARQPALAAYAGREISPGIEVQSEQELDNWLRANLESAYHPCATLAMGKAVDETGQLKVVMK